MLGLGLGLGLGLVSSLGLGVGLDFGYMFRNMCRVRFRIGLKIFLAQDIFGPRYFGYKIF